MGLPSQGAAMHSPSLSTQEGSVPTQMCEGRGGFGLGGGIGPWWRLPHQHRPAWWLTMATAPPVHPRAVRESRSLIYTYF